MIAIEKWPEAPELPSSWEVYERKAAYPAIGRHNPRAGTSGPAVKIAYTGKWIYMVPEALWSSVPKNVRRVITGLYDSGWRSLPRAMAESDEKLAESYGIATHGIALLRQWFGGFVLPSPDDIGLALDAFEGWR